MTKTRGLAAKLVCDGYVRVNGERSLVPARPVGDGDVLTIALERHVRVLRVLGIGARRGPYQEARLLFEEIGDPAVPTAG